jgi:hypothetical protein
MIASIKVIDADPRLARCTDYLSGSIPSDCSISSCHFIGTRACCQVDLVDHRNDLQIVLHGGKRVGHRLRLDPLERIDQQQRPFAARQRLRDTS